MSKQEQRALAEIAANEIRYTLRELTARGATLYKAKSHDGHKIEVVFFKAGLVARNNEVRHRVYLTRYIQAADGAFVSHPSEYEFLRNNPAVRRLVPNNTGTKMVFDKNATAEDLLDLNFYLRTWEPVDLDYR